MIQGRCPICSRRYTLARIDELPSFPFCSERCRLIDLGRWIDGAYVIPGKPGSGVPSSAQGSQTADEIEE